MRTVHESGCPGTDAATGVVEDAMIGFMQQHCAPASTLGATVTIAIVEDDALLREAFCAAVDEVSEFRLLDAVGTLEEGLALLDRGPDVLLVDLALPDGSGLDLIARARATGSAAKVIVISVFGDVRSVVRAIEEGADGYLLKDSDAAHLEAAIHTVLEGGAPISPAVASHILARLREPRPAVPAEPAANGHGAPSCPNLTQKEHQVLEALARGRSFKEVAALHHISLHTVGDHVKAIYRKLAVNSRGEAVFKAVQTGIIRMES